MNVAKRKQLESEGGSSGAMQQQQGGAHLLGGAGSGGGGGVGGKRRKIGAMAAAAAAPVADISQESDHQVGSGVVVVVELDMEGREMFEGMRGIETGKSAGYEEALSLGVLISGVERDSSSPRLS